MNGCLQMMKVSQIEKHEETCNFGKTECQYPECVQKTHKGKEKIHSENCPFSLYVCEKGCGKEMKLIEVFIKFYFWDVFILNKERASWLFGLASKCDREFKNKEYSD